MLLKTLLFTRPVFKVIGAEYELGKFGFTLKPLFWTYKI
jgi:hypothetical protein